jgi:hypothetical protein
MNATTISLDDLRGLRKLNHKDGSQGDIAGHDITFEFAGRRWEYRCAYDRYILVEKVDGQELQIARAGASADAPMVLFCPRRNISQPADADALRLWESRSVLDNLARSREVVDVDRTGLHKGDTAL